MSKTLLIRATLLVASIAAAIVALAAFNLNWLVRNRGALLLNLASRSLGRTIEARAIGVRLRWGVGLDLVELTIADDSRFSPMPLLQVGEVYCKVSFWPLLFRRLEVTRLVLRRPQLRIIRDQDGTLNLSTIGSKKAAQNAVPARRAARPAKTMGPRRARRRSRPPVAIELRSLAIKEGRLFYEDKRGGGQPLILNGVELSTRNFVGPSSFDVSLALAAFGDKQNISLKGSIGPLIRDGRLDLENAELALTARLGPLELEALRQLPELKENIPDNLQILGPVSAYAKIAGTINSLSFEASGDLTSNRVVFGPIVDKPQLVPVALDARGAWRSGRLEIEGALLRLAGVKLELSGIRLARDGLAVRVDSDSFAISALAPLLAGIRSYDPKGSLEVHAAIGEREGEKPKIDGVFKLSNVGMTLGPGKPAAFSNLSGTVKVIGESAEIGPLAFELGSNRASLEGHARSLEPLEATYRLLASVVKTADFLPGRPANERLDQVSISGTVTGSLQQLKVQAALASPSGTLAEIPYRDAALNANWDQARKGLVIQSGKLGALDGYLAGSGQLTLASEPRFTANLKLDAIDLGKALAAEQAKAAGTIRGTLTAELDGSGEGRNFDELKSGLRANGRARLVKAKLVGINLAARALEKVNGIPGIDDLVPPRLVRRHAELFANPDTDIEQASLSYVLKSGRISSPNIDIESADYSIRGRGWFDVDSNVDLAGDVLLSKELSLELAAERKNVVFLTDDDGRVKIPLRVTGRLAKPQVVPDIVKLARRAGRRLLQLKAKGLLKKFFGIKAPRGAFSPPTPP